MNTTWYEWAWGAAAGGRELLEDRFGTLPVPVQERVQQFASGGAWG